MILVNRSSNIIRFAQYPVHGGLSRVTSSPDPVGSPRPAALKRHTAERSVHRSVWLTLSVACTHLVCNSVSFPSSRPPLGSLDGHCSAFLNYPGFLSASLASGSSYAPTLFTHVIDIKHPCLLSYMFLLLYYQLFDGLDCVLSSVTCQVIEGRQNKSQNLVMLFLSMV